MRSELSLEILHPALLRLSCRTRSGNSVPFDAPVVEGTVRKFHQSFWLNERASERNRSKLVGMS